MNRKIGTEVFSPGEFIREELEARGWTQNDLATVMGRPLRTVNEIISAKKAVTPETAVGLGHAFGTSASLWLNLESNYRLSLVANGGDEVVRKSRLFQLAPINEMLRRAWLAPCGTVDELEEHVLRFFEIESLDQKPKMSFAARKSTPYGDISPTQLAWFFRAKHLAREIAVRPYSKTKLDKAIQELKSLIVDVTKIREIPTVLANSGVRFLVVEQLGGSKVDGAAFWLSKNEPVVALSIRYDRIDSFWHSLCHEIGHIYNEDDVAIDTNLIGGDGEPTNEKPKMELKADEFAAQFSIPKIELDNFITRTRPYYARKTISDFARRLGVHPGIVVGQLQHRKEINYSHSREMLEKVRSVITAAATTDGWGQTARTDIVNQT